MFLYEKGKLFVEKCIQNVIFHSIILNILHIYDNKIVKFHLFFLLNLMSCCQPFLYDTNSLLALIL